jgi:2-polyprenyl-3-methyl-5-hydroxy-6-metoxy-1,4-benzoquinol methylase
LHCSRCGFEFLDPQPSDAVLNSLYSDQYFLNQETEEKKDQLKLLKRATSKLYLKEWKKRVDFLQNNIHPIKLLEVGCGTGDFAEEAIESGYDYSGIEISEHAVNQVNHKLGRDAIKQGEIVTATLADNYFNAISAFDVIEHVRKPMNFLSSVFLSLKPGGVIFFTTPSLDSLTKKIMGKRWMEYKIEHLYYFNKKSMRIALENIGFRDIKTVSNPKILSINYIAAHFNKFPVPVFTFFINLIRRILYPFADIPFRISGSGMMVFAKK